MDTSSDEVDAFDVDYFDPAIMPSTGTPEPGRFLYNETLEIFREMNRQVEAYNRIRLLWNLLL